MIRTSIFAGSVAFGVALGIHSWAAVAMNDDLSVEIEANAGAQTAALGSSFADMVAGTVTAPQPEETVQPNTAKAVAEPAKPMEPLSAEQPQKDLNHQPTPNVAQQSEQVEQKVVPTTAPVTQPAQQTTALITATAARSGPLPAPSAADPVSAATPAEQPIVSTPVSPALEQPLKPLSAPKPTIAHPVSPSAPEPQGTVEATDAVRAITPSTSPRPNVRSQELEKRAVAAQAKAAAGNAKKTARKGSATGSRKAKAAKRGNKGTAKKSGNAAVSNYPGRVMARLSSIARPSVNARGTAYVTFTIAASGHLSRAGVSRSSGSRRLDNAAVDMIYSASPFPKPPAGARRTFSISISGR